MPDPIPDIAPSAAPVPPVAVPMSADATRGIPPTDPVPPNAAPAAPATPLPWIPLAIPRSPIDPAMLADVMAVDTIVLILPERLASMGASMTGKKTARNPTPSSWNHILRGGRFCESMVDMPTDSTRADIMGAIARPMRFSRNMSDILEVFIQGIRPMAVTSGKETMMISVRRTRMADRMNIMAVMNIMANPLKRESRTSTTNPSPKKGSWRAEFQESMLSVSCWSNEPTSSKTSMGSTVI